MLLLIKAILLMAAMWGAGIGYVKLIDLIFKKEDEA
jgi:hypothetical protein